MFKISEHKKKAGIYCCAYNCTNKPSKKKGGLCHKHYKRKRRILVPIENRWNNFLWSAKKRNIIVGINYEQFTKFCLDNNYILGKGNRGLNKTIDKKCSFHGYYIWNMQILTMNQNRKKSNKVSDNFGCPF